MTTSFEYASHLHDVYSNIPKKSLRDTECPLIVPEYFSRKLLFPYQFYQNGNSPVAFLQRMLSLEWFILTKLREDASVINSKKTPVMEDVFAFMWDNKDKSDDIASSVLVLCTYLQGLEVGEMYKNAPKLWAAVETMTRFTPFETLRHRFHDILGKRYVDLPINERHNVWLALSGINWVALSAENGVGYNKAMELFTDLRQALDDYADTDEPTVFVNIYSTFIKDLSALSAFLIRESGFFA